MKKIYATFIIAFLLGSVSSFGQIIISQIYEGASYNKFIEITNIGSAPVDLSSPQLTIKSFMNKTDIGTNTPNYTKDLSGTLAPGQSYLIRHGAATIPAYAISYTPGDTNMVANFNGTGSNSAPLTSTDIITLYNGTTLVDVFSWGTFQYKDQSFYRKLSVGPNATWTLAEWDSTTNTAVDNALPNTIERLGYHGVSSVAPVLIITSPANSSTIYSADVNIVLSTTNFILGTNGQAKYIVDGGAPSLTSASPISLTSLAAGPHTVSVELVDMSGVSLAPIVADTVTFTINLTPPVVTPIYDIQYTTLPSGATQIDTTTAKTTTGLVTAKFTSGYFIQAGTNPWNGLYVYDFAHSPALGDSILVTGMVSEYKLNTELKTITYFYVISSGNTLPVPIDVTTASVKTEQYEGMLVKITDATCTVVNPTGWWKVVQGSDTCEIGKLMYPFPGAVVGNYYTITGVVEYYYGFQVDPRFAADVIDHGVGISENEINNISIYPNPVSDMLTIANIKGIDQVNISNILGETITAYNISGNTLKINTGKLQSGIYFITFVKDNTISGTRKFIKQ